MNNNPILAKPTATDVVIVGEALVGGTVVGSYRYLNDVENPEQGSTYTWYLNGSPTEHTLHFHIRPEHAGKRLIFAVTPQAQSGETGMEALSPEKTISAGFQNISLEESEASFLKQRGNFSLYREEPSDRVFVSTGGAFAAIDPKTQRVFVEGEKDWGADVPPDMKILIRNNPATRLFATEKCFAAMIDITPTNNRLLVWGPGIAANQGSFLNVKSVYSNRTVFAFIYKDPQGSAPRIGAIGPSSANANGAVIPDSIQLELAFDPPKAIYATENAFAVLTERGKVYAWGNTNNGGTINAFVRQQLNNMTVNRIVSTDSAFCATDANGTLVTWGTANRGGTIPSNVLESILDDDGVNTVVANRASFLVVTKRRRKAYSFGRAGQGGDMSAAASELAVRGNIALCQSSNWAHAMCNDNGQFTSWGTAAHGGTPPTSRPPRQADPDTDMSLLFEHSGVKAELEAYFQNDPIVGHPTDRVTSTVVTASGSTIDIHSTDSSFFLYSKAASGLTEKVVAWGQANAGGSMPTGVRQVLESSVIEAVYTTNGAYGVIVTQGATQGVVVVWGVPLSRGDAGEIPPVLAAPLRSGVIEIYSIKRWPQVSPTPEPVDPSFAARINNHTYGLWGGNVNNQLYDPSAQDTRAQPIFKRRFGELA
ncbi:hypothetical protein [Pseudomonas asplenii]|uniref:hypothetical protein n=1 Tax=Pseudomonas asplenii TaxID=53407 RepID=UPI0003796678|nr:hypothetical protein [Pseudomonas fuscovaginae]